MFLTDKIARKAFCVGGLFYPIGFPIIVSDFLGFDFLLFHLMISYYICGVLCFIFGFPFLISYILFPFTISFFFDFLFLIFFCQNVFLFLLSIRRKSKIGNLKLENFRFPILYFLFFYFPLHSMSSLILTKKQRAVNLPIKTTVLTPRLSSGKYLTQIGISE